MRGSQALDALIILFALVAIYWIWRFAKGEESDFKRIISNQNDMATDIQMISRDSEENKKTLKNQRIEIEFINTKLQEQKKELDFIQDHLSKVREQQMILRNKLVPKKVQVKHIGAVPVEIMSPSRKKTIEKVKKQIKALSK